MVRTQAARKSTAASKARSPTVQKTSRAPLKGPAKVTETSDAMDIEKDVFKSDSPKHIAASVKHSAERSNRRKSSPFRSAMSTLNFYINRWKEPLGALQTGAQRRQEPVASSPVPPARDRVARRTLAVVTISVSHRLARRTRPRAKTPARTRTRERRGIAVIPGVHSNEEMVHRNASGPRLS
jgi:hypothetical protein